MELRCMTEEEKYKAVESCNAHFDGSFFYGVGTTGVFCRPSCHARMPKRENIRYFDAAEDAISAGFRPCKKCRPDLLNFEPEQDLINKAKELLQRNYSCKTDLLKWARELGISEGHLIRLFKRVCGLTPIQYLIALRVEAAKERLLHSEDSILCIASETGFFSLSHFYKCFKAQTGLAPQDYRQQRGQRI